MNNNVTEQSDTSVVLDTNLYDRDPAKGVNIAYKLLSLNTGPYQPINIEFLSHNGRKFLQRWYNIYNWLEYSPSTHSAYCFNCRAFSPNNSDSSFIDGGFCTWSKATFAFNKHEKSLSHKHSTLKVNSYKASFISGSVADKVDNHHQHELAENRMYLSNLLDSLLFCGRQGIGIRGHREDESSLNKGNYLELLNLRAKDNTIINRFFIEKEKTFRYVSVPYTNMFLNYMGKNIKDSIINDIQQAIIFSIIVDETQDLARHEQVSVCVRYVSKTLEPHEVFLGFYRTASTDGESLTTLIKEVILSNGLSINNIRGQCYDGAASMCGSYSGVQARIRDENKLAVYVHCYAHILNLCLVDLSKVIPHVRNTFGTLQSLYSFIGASSKRYSIFEQIMLETSSNGKNKLKSLSDTRWNCRIESIKAQEIVNSYDFLSPKMPRKRSLPVKKIGGGSIHPEFTDDKDFYRIEMYYLILDAITQAIKDKFNENDLKILNSINNILVNENPDLSDIQEVSAVYRFDVNELKSEIIIFNRMFISLKKEVNFENKLAYIKKVEVGSGFPILVDVFKLFLTIPMNSASCERSFSCLRRLKNYLRTTMGQTRLSDLGLLYIHKDKEVNKDAVIDKFCADNKRRINLK
ncbi:zinc finger MYM-type protein 1-like [Metopolophium dirhodum]|uniref:zinc finger MYM-type protein 1-like n=1 Tax=Metopolophium dirhodum TaxID=44670 RepID=UPI00298F7710|nr:zinc finger MYM-type protein 1-like [Metopolophium dirhodum]